MEAGEETRSAHGQLAPSVESRGEPRCFVGVDSGSRS